MNNAFHKTMKPLASISRCQWLLRVIVFCLLWLTLCAGFWSYLYHNVVCFDVGKHGVLVNSANGVLMIEGGFPDKATLLQREMADKRETRIWGTQEYNTSDLKRIWGEEDWIVNWTGIGIPSHARWYNSLNRNDKRWRMMIPYWLLILPIMCIGIIIVRFSRQKDTIGFPVILN